MLTLVQDGLLSYSWEDLHFVVVKTLPLLFFPFVFGES